MVEECLRLAPGKIVVANRNGQRVMPLEKNRTLFGTGSDLPYTIDFETGVGRTSMKKDVELAARLPRAQLEMARLVAGGREEVKRNQNERF